MMRTIYLLLPAILWLFFLILQALVYDFIILPDDESVFHFFALVEFFWISSFLLLCGFQFVWEGRIYRRFLINVFFVIVIYLTLLFYSSEKSLINFVNPYHLDEFFYNVDKWLHFGKLPHTYISEKPSELLVDIMNWFYWFWFFYIYIGVTIYMVFQKNIIELQKVIISFSAVWLILGVYVATMGSSYGPIFWDAFDNDYNPYHEYISHLRGMVSEDKLGKTVYDKLLEWRDDEHLINMNGISAMPSLHVALVALIFFQTPLKIWWLKIVTGSYMVVILIGSIVLGWHYAIDGYVGILGAYIIYKIFDVTLNKYSDFIKTHKGADVQF